MGAPTGMLVLVSLMYDNPKGFTREELLDKFGKIKLDRNFSQIAHNLNFGFYGFAKLFNLGHSQEYLENWRKYWDKEYKYRSKYELIMPQFGQKVFHHSHKKIGETILRYHDFDGSECIRFEGYKKGEYVWKSDFGDIIVSEEYQNPKNRFFVKKVLDTKIIRDSDDETCSEINQVFEVDVLEFKSKTFQFNSFENLWRKYPEYHPERKYNFNQEAGFLYPHKDLGAPDGPSFKWLKKGDKYFLDFEHFYKIVNANSYFGNEEFWKHENQENKSGYSLTDVVLTSEAIRRKNWRVLGYNALFNYNKNFVYKNERTLRKYEKAVFDTEISVEAQKKSWNHSDFLREHHFDNLSRNIVPYEEMKSMLKEQNKQKGIAKRKATLQWKRDKENEEPELPF